MIILEDSLPLAHFCHQLVVEKFSRCDFVQMFPSRDKLPEVSTKYTNSILTKFTSLFSTFVVFVQCFCFLLFKLNSLDFVAVNFIERRVLLGNFVLLRLGSNFENLTSRSSGWELNPLVAKSSLHSDWFTNCRGQDLN